MRIIPGSVVTAREVEMTMPGAYKVSTGTIIGVLILFGALGTASVMAAIVAVDNEMGRSREYRDDGGGWNPGGSDPWSSDDRDGDGYDDWDDSFPDDSSQWRDSDGDGYGDNPSGSSPDYFPSDSSQWADSDGDGYGDNSWGSNADNCVYDYNPSQSDWDWDGEGDSCDSDIDGDGWSNSNDWFDKGDGYIRIKWTYFNSNQGSGEYDFDNSAPDPYGIVKWDVDCDGDYEYTYNQLDQEGRYDDKWTLSQDILTVTRNIPESNTKFCWALNIMDYDGTGDDTLDYVDESDWKSYYFTDTLSEGMDQTESYSDYGSNRGIGITFVIEAY